MRYLVIADVHSNLDAFQTVVWDAEKHGGFDKLWCIGDIVGYGPQPHECIEFLKQHDSISVAGNHDLAAIGKIDVFDFNPHAARAVIWTSEQLTDSDVEYLKSLPFSYCEGDFTMVHGSPRNNILEYITSISVAKENFRYFDTRYCIFGHTHIPAIFEMKDGNAMSLHCFSGAELDLKNKRLILNPGGVGQPRDYDPRASYALYDSESGIFTFYRVEYDISKTQKKMEKAGLPDYLIERLSYGW